MNEMIDETVNVDGTESFDDFMGGIEKQLLNLVKESAAAPGTAWEHWQAFSSAVNWNETWIRCLIAFHIFVLIAVLVTRKNVDFQTALFVLIGLTVYFSERLNALGNEHWRVFATQNYFDKSGVFTGLMLSGPLILILLFQLVNFLILTSGALITVKRAELKRKLKDEKASAAVDAGNETTGIKSEIETNSVVDSKKDK